MSACAPQMSVISYTGHHEEIISAKLRILYVQNHDLIPQNNRNFTVKMFWTFTRKYLMLILLNFYSGISLYSQQTDTTRVSRHKARKEKINLQSKLMEEGVLQYRKQWVAGFNLTSDGYGGFVELGRYKSARKTWLYQLSISERKHLKEEKLEAYEASMQPFIYGKLNFVYPVKLGMHLQYLLGNKGNTNGINVTLNAGGGLSLALLRPYQYQLTEDSLYILGGPNFSDGWNKIKVKPGIHLKSGIRFDYGKFKDVIAGLEIGIMTEYYFQPIPQMVLIKQRKEFTSIYLSLIMGKRK